VCGANANHYVTGRDGGRDIDLRRFASEGMNLSDTSRPSVGKAWYLLMIWPAIWTGR